MPKTLQSFLLAVASFFCLWVVGAALLDDPATLEFWVSAIAGAFALVFAYWKGRFDA